MKIRRILFPFLFLTLIITLGGCLVYQTIEYRLTLNRDGKSGSILIQSSNIGSSALDTAKQDEDFSELVSNWKEDKYLLSRMDDGVYLKQRSLMLKNGVLVWKESGIFDDIQKLKDGVSYEDTTRITVGKDQTVVSTNGAMVITKDSTVVFWPPHTRDFRIKIQQRNFEPTSRFAEKFRLLRKK